MVTTTIPTTGTRSALASSLIAFLKENPTLRLGGDVDFRQERRHHLEVFGFHDLDKDEQAVPPSDRYVSPGMQQVQDLKGLPPSALFTCGFDPLRDVGVEYGNKLQQAGNEVAWHHYGDLTHGFLRMAPWSPEAMKARRVVAKEVKRLAYGS